MIIRPVLLAFMMLASLFFTGCVSSRAVTTLKSGQNTTCSVGAGKFRIAVLEFSRNPKGALPHNSEPAWITADELNQVAVKLYPGLFSDDRAAWPPLGLIPVSGPSDARGTSLDFSALVNLTCGSVVEATAMQLTRLDAAEISKLTDQAWLAKVAIEDTNESVRKVAARKLNDQACLANLNYS